MKKSYKGFMAWLVLFCVGVLAIIFMDIKNIDLVGLVLGNYMFITLAILTGKIVFEEYAGWLPFYVEGSVYIKMFIMTVISYLFVMMIQMRKIKKIPMDEALKNVE